MYKYLLLSVYLSDLYVKIINIYLRMDSYAI